MYNKEFERPRDQISATRGVFIVYKGGLLQALSYLTASELPVESLAMCIVVQRWLQADALDLGHQVSALLRLTG